MAFFGKVARLRLFGALAAVSVISAAALASPLAPEAVQWKDHPTIPVEFTPKYISGAPAGALIENVPGIVVGELAGTVRTRIYKDASDGHLTFEYVISRDNTGDRAAVKASVDGAGWQTVQILNTGADTTGASSGNGDPSAEWADGTPYFITRDPALGTPTWTFRAAGLTTIVPPVVKLLGTTIGAGDTSARVWFETDATEWVAGSIALITDTGNIGRADVLVPIPEPATLTGLAVASGLLLFSRRNRRS